MQEELLALRITPEEKNQIFKGAIVVARYGNYKTYVIESIDYSRDPDSTFEIKRGNEVMQVSYREYYERQYHIKIKGPKQPMIRALVKVDQQIQKGKKLTQKTHAIMLVPELVSLTGLSREQRNDEALMQEVADLSRATPQIRFEDSAKLIKVLEAEKKADKLTIGSSVLITGSILPVPSMTVEGSQESDVNPYSMNAPEMKLPIRVLGNREIVVLYSGRSNKSEVIAFYNLIRESSQTFGIVFPPEPQTIEVPLTADQKQQNYNWGRSTSQYLSQLSLQEKAQLILIFFFNPNEEDIYNTLKEGTIRRFHVKSQAILTSSLSKSQTAMSVAGKIGLQIAAKRGISLWEVKKKHPYWSSKRVAIASLGYSRSLKGSFTVAMVGSTNNIQTEIYNYCQTDLLNRDALPREVLEQFYNHWIWQFFQNERSLPDTLIIYREGLSDSQLRRTLAGELEVIESVVGGYSGKELNNFLPYRPEIVFLTVNKKINSRFYMQRVEQKGEVSEKAYYNPKPGAVIYNELASNDQIDFYLVPQKTETGTASPCQYRLVYYHPQHEPFPYDHSKAEVPLQAIAQMTYEQCYNYYNWTGAVRTPAILQYTRKLSKLAGEHIQRPVNKQEIVATLKERISREHVDKTND
jgi:aubergine